MTKNEQKYINSLKEENERVKTLLLRFMSALEKVQTVEEIESIMLIPIMLEDNKKFRAEIKSEAYKEFAERLKAIVSNGYWYDYKKCVSVESIVLDKKDYDNLLKELVGKNE